MIDRRLLAILATIGIMSTALVSLLFHEKITEPIEILRHDWNLPTEGGRMVIPAKEGRFAYTLSMIVRRPITNLELRFAALENQTLPTNLSSPDMSDEEKILSVPEVGDIIQTVEGFAQVSPMEVEKHSVEFKWRGQPYVASVLDLTESFEALAPTEIPRGLHTLHAFLITPEGLLSQYYRGVPDFFVYRDVTIVDLKIQRNDNVTKYAQRASLATGTVPLDLAPPLGAVNFRNLKKDDRISITIAFNPARVPGRGALMQLVTFNIDDECYTSFVNILERSAIR